MLYVSSGKKGWGTQTTGRAQSLVPRLSPALDILKLPSWSLLADLRDESLGFLRRDVPVREFLADRVKK